MYRSLFHIQAKAEGLSPDQLMAMRIHSWTFRRQIKKATELGRSKPLILLEAAIGIEPMNKGFADLCLTTWLRRLKTGVGSWLWTVGSYECTAYCQRQTAYSKRVERETRVELATSTLARSRSTTELLPHANDYSTSCRHDVKRIPAMDN